MNGTAEMPPCHCASEGQPITEFGVVHQADCEWFIWFASTGGCQGAV